jgi:DnaA family protein
VAQLPLALSLDSHAVFETFVEGPNGAALAHVRALASGAGRGTVWLGGPRASGKSHALQAACSAAGREGKRAMYLPLAAPEVVPDLLANLEELEFLALDDLQCVAGRPVWETRLFQVLNGFLSGERGLLLAASAAPGAAGFLLPDLASRAAGAAVYRLQRLDEAQQVEALLRHASHRGLELDRSAARFLQARVPRDMGVLCAWLQRLDRASLAAQRRLTIPFIRELLGEHSSSRAAAQDEEQAELDERGQQHDAGEGGAPERGDDLDGGRAGE